MLALLKQKRDVEAAKLYIPGVPLDPCLKNRIGLLPPAATDGFIENPSKLIKIQFIVEHRLPG
ncbi:MAG: hypothetical protein P8X55_14505 [Desulfosarcinaceae bacterium]